jgi:hypothetical protein
MPRLSRSSAMDREAVLAAFDEQIRRHRGPNGPDEHVEREERVIRIISNAGGWAGVTWSDLDAATADAFIAAQVSRFAHLARSGERKHCSYDRPRTCPSGLAAGMTPEPAEARLRVQTTVAAVAMRPRRLPCWANALFTHFALSPVERAAC